MFNNFVASISSHGGHDWQPSWILILTLKGKLFVTNILRFSSYKYMTSRRWVIKIRSFAFQHFLKRSERNHVFLNFWCQHLNCYGDLYHIQKLYVLARLSQYQELHIGWYGIMHHFWAKIGSHLGFSLSNFSPVYNIHNQQILCGIPVRRDKSGFRSPESETLTLCVVVFCVQYHVISNQVITKIDCIKQTDGSHEQHFHMNNILWIIFYVFKKI